LPIHDYVCSNCGHSMEVMHSVHGHGPETCPLCGGHMKKTLAAPSVHYKGTGWARKDRSSGSRVSQASSKDPGSTSGDSSGSGAAAGSDSVAGSGSASESKTAAAPAPSKDPD
jgi:putative FmdB family regulatory protein